MSRNRLSEQIKDLAINEIEEKVIIGCLLGDATLSKSGKFHRLRIEQKASHLEYVEWKFSLLKRLCITPPQFNRKHNLYRFGTVGHPKLSKLYSIFYGEDKTIHPSVLSKISNLSIAIWFMDDGYKIHNTVGISANNFSSKALDQLRQVLTIFGISTSLQTDKQGKRIYILTESYRSFEKLVKPYVDQIKCMTYKLPNPVETTR
ncbi:MAG: hypothetical protein QME05_06340 [Candidatus Margulisbacteria bacterium]|nr:hypothetical protein [Candidatus Margulisiibacteriota bacterium]